MIRSTASRMIRTTAVAFLLIVPSFLSISLYGQTTKVFDFVRNDATARSAAMGGAFVAVTNDPAGQFYNPASLVTVDSTQASFTFFKHLLDINSGSAAVATTIDGIGSVGLGVNFTSFGSFDRTNNEGLADGTFGATDMLVSLGWGSELGEGFLAGLSGSAIFSTIDNVGSSALAVNGGLMYVDTSKRLSAGLSILHLGTQLSKYGTQSEDLPLDLKIGVTHTLKGLPLMVSLNFSRLLDDRDTFIDRFSSFSVGGEFTVSRPLRLRVGFNNRVRQDVPIGTSKGLSGFSAGLGINVSSYRFDYAFNSLDRVGGLHRVSINAMF